GSTRRRADALQARPEGWPTLRLDGRVTHYFSVGLIFNWLDFQLAGFSTSLINSQKVLMQIVRSGSVLVVVLGCVLGISAQDAPSSTAQSGVSTPEASVSTDQ